MKLHAGLSEKLLKKLRFFCKLSKIKRDTYDICIIQGVSYRMPLLFNFILKRYETILKPKLIYVGFTKVSVYGTSPVLDVCFHYSMTDFPGILNLKYTLLR